MSGNIRYPEDLFYLIFNFPSVIFFWKKKKIGKSPSRSVKNTDTLLFRERIT